MAYARDGAKISVNDKTEEQALSSAKEIRALGQEALPLPADVSLGRPVRDMVETRLRQFGRMDVLVNNAGNFNQSWLMDMSVSTWDHMVQVTLRSVYSRSFSNSEAMKSGSSPSLLHFAAHTLKSPIRL